MRFSSWILILLAGCTSQFSKKERQTLRETPPGTVLLKEGLYIDRTEVANVHWREFVFSQLKTFGESSSEFINSLPDTSVWIDMEYPTDLPDVYFRHPSFNSSPAVGISYKQATAFCEWRTNAVNFFLSQKPNGRFKKVKYRLPTAAEWEMAAADGLDLSLYPYGLKAVYDNKGRRLLRFLPTQKIKDPHSPTIFTYPVDSYRSNQKGIYQLQGNVSEMISEEGIAKGGNFSWSLDSCHVRLNHRYTKPEAWLGFRCVCEIVE